MTGTDFLDDLISSLDPLDVPVEYLIMARIVDSDGNTRVVRGQEIKNVLENPEMYGAAEVRVVLNVKRIREEILDTVREVYLNVEEFLLNRGR